MGQLDRSQAPAANHPAHRLDVLTRPTAKPRVVRLFHRWGDRSCRIAAESLRQALLLVDGASTEQLLVAGAGFVCTGLPQPTDARYPNADEFVAVTENARGAAEAIQSSIPLTRPLVVFGVDVYAACYRSDIERQVGQFAVVLPPDGPPILLPKRFPTPTEEAYLNVPDDQADPICDTPLGRTAILVCHDVNVYSPRGTATTVYETRATWRTALQDLIRKRTPAVGLHLAHYIETATSFRQAYNAWASDVGVPLVGVSGLPSDVTTDDATSLAASLLSGTDELPVLDLIERPTE
ncbi:MAG: hypothetical protein C0467_16130 [Planctomycetaceae bacterium]|nr:hypothetical protein [Planctomycetaceae bacterium]